MLLHNFQLVNLPLTTLKYHEYIYIPSYPVFIRDGTFEALHGDMLHQGEHLLLPGGMCSSVGDFLGISRDMNNQM